MRQQSLRIESTLKRSLQALSLGIVLLAASPARAETIVFQQGTLLPGGATYSGTQDTDVEQAGPDVDFGAFDFVRSDLESFGSEAQGLLRFENIVGLLPNRIPPGSTITSAVLTLDFFNLSNDPAGVISLYRMSTAWSESSTWNTLVDGVEIGAETIAIADDAHTIEQFGTATFDVLPSLQAWAQGDTNLGWVIVNDSTDGVAFWSSEFETVASRPLLTVTFTPPEATPAVPALSRGGVAALVAGLGLSGAALGWMRKRRSYFEVVGTVED